MPTSSKRSASSQPAVKVHKTSKTVSPSFIEAMRRHGVNSQTIEAAERRNEKLRRR